MINLEKIKYGKVPAPPHLLRTPPPPFLRKPAPAPYFQPLFLIFQILPPCEYTLRPVGPGPGL